MDSRVEGGHHIDYYLVGHLLGYLSVRVDCDA
jgi:hypothetical protein